MSSLFRTGLVGSVLIACATGTFWVALSACESLSQTSPLPSGDASDLDAGQPPEEPDEDPGSSSGSTSGAASSSGASAPTSARLRFTNLVQGPSSVTLCVSESAGTSSTPFTPPPQDSPAKQSLSYGETSAAWFVNAAAAGSRLTFKAVAGGGCDGESVGAITTALQVRPGSGFSLVAFGKYENGADAGDSNSRLTSVADNLATPANAAQFRVFHGITDVAAFDVVVNGETLLQGVKYGTPLGFPYTSTNGYANVNAGIPEDAVLTLRSGTTVRSFVIPERLRRGIGSTVYTGGTKDDLTVSLCTDRSGTDQSRLEGGNGLAECKALVSAE